MAAVRFNSSLVKLQHQVWKNKLLTYLNGGEFPVAVSHRDCAIGKWLYAEGGLKAYQSLSEMRLFERQHAQYHDAIKTVIDLKQEGNKTNAFRAYASLESMSDELMDIIDALGRRIETDSTTVAPSFLGDKAA